jgi:hypothetical protein
VDVGHRENVFTSTHERILEELCESEHWQTIDVGDDVTFAESLSVGDALWPHQPHGRASVFCHEGNLYGLVVHMADVPVLIGLEAQTVTTRVDDDGGMLQQSRPNVRVSLGGKRMYSA